MDAGHPRQCRLDGAAHGRVAVHGEGDFEWVARDQLTQRLAHFLEIGADRLAPVQRDDQQAVRRPGLRQTRRRARSQRRVGVEARDRL